MRNKLIRRGLLALALTCSVAGTSLVAYAYWSASGTGSGSVKAIDPADLTLSVPATEPTACLFPGKTCSLSFTVNNTNPYPIKITSYTASVAGTDGSPTTGACLASAQLVVPAGAQPLAAADQFTIAPNEAGTVTRTVNNVVKLSSSAPDDCKGVAFSVKLTLSGTQVDSAQ